MARSVWKGPFVEESLIKKVEKEKNNPKRKALLRNLVSDAIMHGRIRTTKAKAKEARPILEKMITLSKTIYFQLARVSE